MTDYFVVFGDFLMALRLIYSTGPGYGLLAWRVGRCTGQYSLCSVDDSVC
jgi:hypothetical protein